MDLPSTDGESAWFSVFKINQLSTKVLSKTLVLYHNFPVPVVLEQQEILHPCSSLSVPVVF